MATRRLSLKLLVDKSKRTVVFAEAGKDFVDFLFHILALPVGQVIQLLTNTGMVGSLGNLYGSVERLSDAFIESSKKDGLLNPKAPAFLSEIPFLLPGTSSFDSTPNTYYRCSSSPHANFVAEDPSAKCPLCGNSMNQTLTLVKSVPIYYRCSSCAHANCRDYVASNVSAKCPQCSSPMKYMSTLVKPPAANPAAAAASAAESDGKGGFVLGEVMYAVMDDLSVKPMSTISSINLLKKFSAEEIGNLEEMVVSLGMDEGIKLLKTSLHSVRVLTDVFLGVKRERS